MNYNERPEFSKQFRKLAKKYRSLPEDLKEFKKVVGVNPLGTGKHFNIITKNQQAVILKSRFFSRYLKGSTLRIVYSYRQDLILIEFLEIYFKGEKENADYQMIKNYFKLLK